MLEIICVISLDKWCSPLKNQEIYNFTTLKSAKLIFAKLFKMFFIEIIEFKVSKSWLIAHL